MKKTLPYKIKRIIPALGLAGAAAMMPACDKSDEPTQPAPTREIELYFANNYYDNIANMITIGVFEPSQMLIDYANNPEIKTIYLVPQGQEWHLMFSNSITALRHKLLGPLLEYSPKIRGRGSFNFLSGEPSEVPEDSLWFVQNGWTIDSFVSKDVLHSKQR